jgi:hypothetical protein
MKNNYNKKGRGGWLISVLLKVPEGASTDDTERTIKVAY